MQEMSAEDPTVCRSGRASQMNVARGWSGLQHVGSGSSRTGLGDGSTRRTEVETTSRFALSEEVLSPVIASCQLSYIVSESRSAIFRKRRYTTP